MAWGPCEYCGYSECECGMAAAPEWISTKDRLPDDGKEVLWHLPDSDSRATFVGRRDGRSLDAGLDLTFPLPQRAFWMELPPAPVVRKRRRV